MYLTKQYVFIHLQLFSLVSKEYYQVEGLVASVELSLPPVCPVAGSASFGLRPGLC